MHGIFFDSEEVEMGVNKLLKKRNRLKRAIYNWEDRFCSWNKEPEINLQDLEDENYAGALGATNTEDIR